MGLDSDGADIFFYVNTIRALIDSLRGLTPTVHIYFFISTPSGHWLTPCGAWLRRCIYIFLSQYRWGIGWLPAGLDSDGAYVYFYLNTVGALIDSPQGLTPTGHTFFLILTPSGYFNDLTPLEHFIDSLWSLPPMEHIYIFISTLLEHFINSLRGLTPTGHICIFISVLKTQTASIGY